VKSEYPPELERNHVLDLCHYPLGHISHRTSPISTSLTLLGGDGGSREGGKETKRRGSGSDAMKCSSSTMTIPQSSNEARESMVGSSLEGGAEDSKEERVLEGGWGGHPRLAKKL
jgi:hypothetical protein